MARSIYASLCEYLEKKGDASITLSFREVARIVGAANDRLPNSAYRCDLVWWENSLNHTQARCGWRKAGYMAEPDFNKQEVTFTKMK